MWFIGVGDDGSNHRGGTDCGTDCSGSGTGDDRSTYRSGIYRGGIYCGVVVHVMMVA